MVEDLVRIGRDNDGGYVVSRRTIAAATVVLGLGVNDDWSFERDCTVLNPAIRVVAVDGSVSASLFRLHALKAAARAVFAALRLRVGDSAHALRRMVRWLRTARDFRRFFDGRTRIFHERFFATSEGPAQITWATLKPLLTRDRPGEGPHVFVKMDIEGAEYRTLQALLPDASLITGMAIEFHDCDLLWERFAELMNALSRDFVVVHVHGNNCVPLIPGTRCPGAIEISLANRSMVPAQATPRDVRYPLAGLDMPNLVGHPDYPLVFTDA